MVQIAAVAAVILNSVALPFRKLDILSRTFLSREVIREIQYIDLDVFICIFVVKLGEIQGIYVMLHLLKNKS
jgi:hypothetical protein